MVGRFFLFLGKEKINLFSLACLQKNDQCSTYSLSKISIVNLNLPALA